MDTELSCANETDPTAGHTSPGTVATIMALGMVNLAVVLGNSLVVASVITTRKLRTVTNIFIVSLACADLLLGFAVLPFSIHVEIVKVWRWGSVWCSMWLAIDVWLCTASILSLCAISLDRYIAVTRPIRYPSIVSPVRGKVVVSLVWILSFVICLPPLVGWNETGEAAVSHATTESVEALNDSMFSYIDNGSEVSISVTTDMLNMTEEDLLYTDFMLSNRTIDCHPDVTTCELTPTKGYRIYAAMGSFFIPMLVMVFFYLRIYLAAMRTASSLRKGVITTRTSNELAQLNGHGDDSIQLRIHRGGSTSSSQYSYTRGSETVRYQHYQNGSAKSPGSSQTLSPQMSNNHTVGNRSLSMKESGKNNNCPEKSNNCGSVIFMRQFSKGRADMQSPIRRKRGDTELELINQKRAHTSNNTGNHSEQNGIVCDLTSSSSGTRHRRCKLLIKETKSSVNVKGHARKFRRETKAAKTLAIIVGAFIICWFPFFTIYLLGAFCYECVSDIVFSVFFWLGYCNSALNPCIYALFARDFRFAFKRLLSCKRRRGFSNATRAEFVTGTRKALSPIVQECDSVSDY